MKEETYLFYEDVKKRKLFFMLITILFYIGALMSLGAIILYRAIAPECLLAYYQPRGEDIVIAIICLTFAISYTVFVKKSKGLRYYIAITETKIMLLVKDKLSTYEIADLKSYSQIKKNFGLTEFRLLLNDTSILIATKKTQELKTVLDSLIKGNNVIQR